MSAMTSRTSRIFLHLRSAAGLQPRAGNLRSVHPFLRSSTILLSSRRFSTQPPAPDTPTPDEASLSEPSTSDSRLVEEPEPTTPESVQDVPEPVSPTVSQEGQVAVDAPPTIDPEAPVPSPTATPSTTSNEQKKKPRFEITHISELSRRSTWHRDIRNQITEIRRRKQDTRDLESVKKTHDVFTNFLGRSSIGLMLGMVSAVSAGIGLKEHPVAWGDMDSMENRAADKLVGYVVLTRHFILVRRLIVYLGHVNNTVYNRWAETSRVNLLRNLSSTLKDKKQREECLGLLSNRGVGLIMKSIKTEFKFPVTWPDSITVAHVLVNKPQLHSTSLEFRVYMYSRSHKRLVAKCYEEITIYDYKKARKTTLPPYLVHLLQAMFKKQVDMGIDTQHRVRAVERSLREMESLPDKSRGEGEEAVNKEAINKEVGDKEANDKESSAKEEIEQKTI